ncbi:MAG: hypothetical protein HY376_02160 [Candidatus Blackburnbacteria bacterium]|nr:hypothetical protein [Candidatus Blackburnbacteria bacterium]
MPFYSRNPQTRHFTPRHQQTACKPALNTPQTPLKQLLLRCHWCGTKYHAFEGFKYLQCEFCPWTIVESVHVKQQPKEGMYPNLRQDNLVHEGRIIGRLYEVVRNRYIPVEDEKDKKKRKGQRLR